MMRHLFALPLLLALAACGTPPAWEMQTGASATRVTTAARSIMVREVSMPDYAADDAMARQDANGAVSVLNRVRWADVQPRAVTLALARQLNDSLSATVAPEPWPLAGLPDGEVDVRIERILAGSDRVFRLNGVFYVRAEGVNLGASSRNFAIAVPMAGTEPADIAAAQSQAVARLAQDIARSVAR
ncbi:PqiC family protein [Falsirhodobacter halotolerans]|uniref:PqiC family protein n=1 Tax=Falsirhodobacter halotolerans TaxID=1146892 RepID=UPI001FD17747|nr:PqiC family protein [Falsirhodobacter halotolerans]MCJ8139805.1 PqiC family protein [Falsirhodobacter halotolerans]